MIARAHASDDPAPLHTLTTKQRAIVELIDAFQQTTGESCSANYLARRLSIDDSTVRDHLVALYRKGWLRAPNAPAWLRRPLRT